MATKYPNVDAANKWARRVVRGAVPACKYVRQACQRHLDDLVASRTAAFQYKFDAAAAERKISLLQLLPHVKGEWALQRKLILLEDWQRFGLVVMFGWVKKRSGLRRYREAYWEVPRKNGKSVIAASVGIGMFVADDEFGAEVYSGATTEKQAWEVFRPARLMVKRTQPLIEAAGIEVNASNLNLPADGSRFEPVIGTPGDGASPSCAIVDEYHEHATAALYDTMLTGMGARKQPLMFVITTAGSNIEGPCYDMRGRVIAMLDGTVPDDELFGWIWTIDEGDDWTDPAVLAKANPNIGVSVYQEYLESQQRKAIKNASFQNTFKTKHLNVWVSARSAYFNMQAYQKCADTSLNIEDFIGESCLIAIDLAKKIDICGRINLFYRYEDDGRLHYYCISPEFYLPSQTIEYGTERDVVERYQRWVNMGLLTPHDGAEISFVAFRDDLISDCKIISPVELPMDEWFGAQMAQELSAEGLQPVLLRPTTKVFSPAMKELNAAILAGRFHHDGNPILGWMMGNVTNKPDGFDQDFPRKEKSSKKIDGAVALLMGVSRAMVLAGEPSGNDFYDDPIMVGA